MMTALPARAERKRFTSEESNELQVQLRERWKKDC